MTGLPDLPTLADADLGRLKIDKPAPAGFTQTPDLRWDVTAGELNALKNRIIQLGGEVGMHDGSTAGSLVKRVASLEGGSPLIWRWNETDVAQLRVSFDGNGGGGAVISRQTPAQGPRVRIAFPTKANTDLLQTLITVQGLDIPRDGSGFFRYVWEFDVLAFSGGGVTQNEWFALGPAILCRDVALGGGAFGLACGAQIGGATRFGVIKNDVPSTNSDTPGWGSFSANIGTDAADHVVHFRVEVSAKKVTGSGQPRLLAKFECFSPQSAHAVLCAFGQSDAYWNSIAAFSTTWDAILPTTVGIWIMGHTGTTANQFFELANLRVSKHPMDL